MTWIPKLNQESIGEVGPAFGGNPGRCSAGVPERRLSEPFKI